MEIKLNSLSSNLQFYTYASLSQNHTVLSWKDYWCNKCIWLNIQWKLVLQFLLNYQYQPGPVPACSRAISGAYGAAKNSWIFEPFFIVWGKPAWELVWHSVGCGRGGGFGGSRLQHACQASTGKSLQYVYINGVDALLNNNCNWPLISLKITVNFYHFIEWYRIFVEALNKIVFSLKQSPLYSRLFSEL
jgi:hypothetical protein